MHDPVSKNRGATKIKINLKARTTIDRIVFSSAKKVFVSKGLSL